MRRTTSAFFISGCLLFLGMTGEKASRETLRIRAAHFPTVTHAPALIARGQGHFERRFGDKVEIQWKTFHAGPEAIEALFAGAIDILYVGPSPAINGFVRSHGEALRIVSGVTSGGAGFVARPDSGIKDFKALRGKRVATPQKGNTQDVAMRHLMRVEGLTPRTQGGGVEIFHLSGGDQITALLRKEVDALWTVEPWLTRLAEEADGQVLFEEETLWPGGKYATTVLVFQKKFMEAYPHLAEKWVEAHIEIIEWIRQNTALAKELFNEEFKKETGKLLPSEYLDRMFARLDFTTDPMEQSVFEYATRAYEIGYLGKTKPDLTKLYELSFLEAAAQ